MMLRRRSSLRDQGDAGFSLIELLVAVVVVALVLLSLGGVFVSSKRTIAESKQRQAATGLATRVIEQLRALPYDTVIAGLKNDAAALGADPDIALVSGVYRFKPTWDASIDEVLQVGSSGNQEPLNPHIRSTSVGGVSYRVKTYVSRVPTSSPPRYWFSAAVTWSSAATSGKTERVVSRSQAYSPTGCLSTATRPFSGPCQASFYGQAGNSISRISIEPETEGGPLVPGLDVTGASIELRDFEVRSAIEQVVTVAGRGVDGAAKVLGSVGASTTGGASALSAASTDPSNATTLTPAATTSGAATTSQRSVDSAVASFTADVAKSTSSSTSTTSAAGACRDTADVAISNSQPCASAASASGGGSSLNLTLKGATRVLPLDLFLSGNASAPSRAFAARFTAATPTWCPTSSGVGCSAAAATRHLGAMTFAGLPAGASAGEGPPAGFDGMVKTSNYVATVSAAAGVGGAAPAATVNGSVQVWNGVGYETLALSSITQPLQRTLTPVTATYNDGLQSDGVTPSSWSITISGTVAVGGSELVAPTGTCQAEACAGTATVRSPVQGTLTYSVLRDGLPLTSFKVQIGLGDVLAKASYKAAPSA